jgi:hypothetical protein
MDKIAISASMKALASSDEKRSKAARLRDVLADVEMALEAGAKYADVLSSLNAHGLDMSMTTFATTLKRLRAQKQMKIVPENIKSNFSTEIANEVNEKESAPSHNPADLDRIINSKPDLAALAKAAKGRKK